MSEVVAYARPEESRSAAATWSIGLGLTAAGMILLGGLSIGAAIFRVPGIPSTIARGGVLIVASPIPALAGLVIGLVGATRKSRRTASLIGLGLSTLDLLAVAGLFLVTIFTYNM